MKGKLFPAAQQAQNDLSTAVQRITPPSRQLHVQTCDSDQPRQRTRDGIGGGVCSSQRGQHLDKLCAVKIGRTHRLGQAVHMQGRVACTYDRQRQGAAR